MAKKTSTATAKGGSRRSSGGTSTRKGNSSSNRRTTTKGGQSNNDDYNNDYYSSGNSKGGSSSHTKGGGAYSENYNSGSSRKGQYSNEDYSSGDSYDSAGSKGGSGYSDNYDDSYSSAKEGSSYDENYNEGSSSYGTSKDGGNYSDERYESGSSNKNGNAHNDTYDYGDSNHSGSGKNTGGYSNNEPINDPPPYNDYDDEVVAKTPNREGNNNSSKYGHDEGEADMTFTEEEVYGQDRESSNGGNEESRSSTIRRVWVWAGGAVPSRHIGNPQAAWWRNRFNLGMTDYVIALNDHDFSNGLGIRSNYFDQSDSRNRWAPICEILRTINAANVAPHLMIFFPPNPGLIREAAEALGEILENSPVMPRSIQFDLEGWWTRRSERERSAGEQAIQEHFIDRWIAPRPELGFGITCIGSVPGPLNGALNKVDFAIPQIYASERNYGRPIQENSVRRHFTRAAEALGENGKVIAGQTAYSTYVNPQVMKEMLEILIRQRHSNGAVVNEIAYWSDIHLMNSSRNRQFFQRLTNLVRREGLNTGNINRL